MIKYILIALLFVPALQAKDYVATIIEIVDGDTVNCIIELGLDVQKKEKVRMIGLDAPEKKTDEGKKVALEVKKQLLGKEVLIRTIADKREKYGRLLAEIIVGEVNYNQFMIKSGMAKPYNGGPR